MAYSRGDGAQASYLSEKVTFLFNSLSGAFHNFSLLIFLREIFTENLLKMRRRRPARRSLKPGNYVIIVSQC